MKVFEFELKLKEVAVKLDGKDYVIRELTGKQRDTYLDMVDKRVTYVDGVQSGMSSLSGLQSSLLALCLVDSNNKAVPEKDIAEYPGSVQSKLFALAQEVSGLDQPEDSDKEKNA